jgi:uncharacterized SAM-binding protein YcdF (DUF218 family)
MASRADEVWVVALLIGELPYMTRLNDITSRIVERAVEHWRARPRSVLVCEAAPMAELAVSLGVPSVCVRVAINEPHGHTTRWAAERIVAMADREGRSLLLVTHRLHASRAARMFRALGMSVEADGVDAPFSRRDADWKLRSTAVFRFYNALAWCYCYLRGWL